MPSIRRVCLLLAFFLVGCAHAPSKPELGAEELLAQACRPGADIQKVKGSLWIRAKSSEASGQFPAVVEVTGPSAMRLEATNLLGAREALITVDGNRYEIDLPGKQGTRKGADSWGGIPLRWATSLFLGRIPCPVESSSVRLSVDSQGALVAEIPSSSGGAPERYVYRFRSWAGQPWPESLHWESGGAAASNQSVDFKFEDPEDKTNSPRKWEAKSSRGEVKVRWKDRELSR